MISIHQIHSAGYVVSVSPVIAAFQYAYFFLAECQTYYDDVRMTQATATRTNGGRIIASTPTSAVVVVLIVHIGMAALFS